MNIDRQINFAIEKKVKKLEMNLSNCRGISQYNKYFFPHKDFPTCNSLTTLRLKNVNVTGEVIEHFLSNYLALETLYIQSSDSLVNLKVAGPLLRLKYLEIRYFSVKKVEISAVNLISFKYFRPKIRMPLKHAPRLVELAIGGYYCDYILQSFCKLSRYLYQIDTLTLHENMLKILEVPVLTNLKQLKFVADVIDRDPTQLLAITSLIEAASFLQRFIFQVLVLKLLTFGEENKRCPYQHLKVVEILEFTGETVKVELALYIIENAIVLENIIFYTRNPVLIGTQWEFKESKDRKMGRRCARKLGAELHLGVT